MSTLTASTNSVWRGIGNSQKHNNNNNHSFTGAIGNINCTSGAIRSDNNQVNAKFENNSHSNKDYKLRISNRKSFTVRRRITLTSKQMLLTFLLSAVLIQEAKFTTVTTAKTINKVSFLNTSSEDMEASMSVVTRQNMENATGVKQAIINSKNFVEAAKPVAPITNSSMPHALSLISATTITNAYDTSAVPNTVLPAPAFQPLHRVLDQPTNSPSTPKSKPTSISLSTFTTTKPFLTSASPIELFRIDTVVAAAEANDNVESYTVSLEPPPPSDVLIKGFSIPTFLPPFPAFAMADLPAYTSALTSPAVVTSTVPTDPQDQLYLAASKQNSATYNLSLPETNITVQMGNHAYLPCNIHQTLNKPISWVRLRDGHILSVDQATFIADQRFQSIFQGENDFTWSLQIKYAQDTDEGWYECQVSSEPKMSAKVYLGVVVPHTELIGDQNRFVKAGSKVALHCIVRDTLDPPTYIIWFRGKTQITNDNEMGWYTEIDRTIFGDAESNRNTIGSLIIPFVRKKDSGNYTCQPSNSAPVSVDLHVLSGEYSASAIMSTASSYRLNENIIFFLMLSMVLLFVSKT